MAHGIEATAENNRLSVRINADTIAYLVREHTDGPTHIHFVGSDYASGQPDLVGLDEPEVLISRIERPH